MKAAHRMSKTPSAGTLGWAWAAPPAPDCRRFQVEGDRLRWALLSAANPDFCRGNVAGGRWAGPLELGCCYGVTQLDAWPP